MKMSRRAKRMSRNHKRNAAKSALNLTALMDIFTILVFFLMMNQNDSEIQSNDAIQLPKSIAANELTDTVRILVTKDDLLVQGRPIAKMSAIAKIEGDIVPALKKELDYLAERFPLPLELKEEGRAITIMGDKDTPYSVLKRIMDTCAKAEFNNISLAVSQKGEAN
jgi:biopolymer transport protein TolR